jgi:5'-phosphate synthase pdxT subunit
MQRFVGSGRPVWGTCAGMILLADSAGRPQPLVGGLNVIVARNHFGRQLESFEALLDVAGLEGGPFPAVFIRAPAIRRAGSGVEVLARLEGGEIVAVRQGQILATAFHPELTDDVRLHRLFLDMVDGGGRSPEHETGRGDVAAPRDPS